MAAGRRVGSSVHSVWRIRPGSVRSRRAVGAEPNKSKPPGEQGHQIRLCGQDLVHATAEGVQ